jgi:hypothetical protein
MANTRDVRCRRSADAAAIAIGEALSGLDGALRFAAVAEIACRLIAVLLVERERIDDAGERAALTAAGRVLDGLAQRLAAAAPPASAQAPPQAPPADGPDPGSPPP